MKGINRQYQALQGARFARIPLLDARGPTVAGAGDFSPTSSPAGKQAAPVVTPPATGAADLSDNVRIVIRLVSEAEQISGSEVIARAVCRYAERHVGLPGLLGEFEACDARRHANSHNPDLQFVDDCLVGLPDFPRAPNRFGDLAR